MTKTKRFLSRITTLLLVVGLGLLVGGCGGPFLLFPGGELSGTVSDEPIEDWSFVDATFLQLETNADAPYSVELNYVLKEGKLYIDPEEGKKWFAHLRNNLDVRIRFGEVIYPVRAVLVGEPGELQGFDADRYIYRLDSRAGQ